MKFLMLKRILASIVDLVFFLIIGIILSQVLSFFNIKLDYSFTILFNFLIGLIFPIIILDNTVGYYLLRIKYSSSNRLKIKLTVKYFLYFFILSNSSDRIFGFLKTLFENYSIIVLPTTFSIRASFTFLFLSSLIFLFTLGKANLIDLLLKIQFINGSVPRRKILFFASYIFVFILITSGIVEYKLKQQFNIPKFITTLQKSTNYGYYPIDAFGDYLDQEYPIIFQKDENTYNTFSFSNMASFFYNRYIPTRTISVMLNTKTKNSIRLRQLLAYKLLLYERTSSIFEDNDIDQIIFRFYYYEYKYFYYYQYVYTYYYDTKMRQILIHGGPEKEKLKEYYFKVDSSIADQNLTAMARGLNLPKDTLLKYMQKNGGIKLPDSLNKKITSDTIKTSFSLQLPSLSFSIIPFENVKPEIMFGVTYPIIRTKMINFIEPLNNEYSIYSLRNNTINNRLFEYR